MVPLLPRPRSLARKMVAKNGTDHQRRRRKKKEEEGGENNKNSRRMLITVSVGGSTGPLRFVVNETDLVSEVIHITLRSYAGLGRLPLLPSSQPNDFLLHTPLKPHGLGPKEAIGCCGARNFILWKKETNMDVKETIEEEETQKRNRRWKSKWKSCFIVESKPVLASS